MLSRPCRKRRPSSRDEGGVSWVFSMYFFSLECNEMSSNELWDVYGFGVTLGCLYLGAQGCVPCCWRICLVCLALELVGPCVVLGFSACASSQYMES